MDKARLAKLAALFTMTASMAIDVTAQKRVPPPPPPPPAPAAPASLSVVDSNGIVVGTYATTWLAAGLPPSERIFTIINGLTVALPIKLPRPTVPEEIGIGSPILWQLSFSSSNCGGTVYLPAYGGSSTDSLYVKGVTPSVVYQDRYLYIASGPQQPYTVLSYMDHSNPGLCLNYPSAYFIAAYPASAPIDLQTQFSAPFRIR